jgi:uncharacterized protein (TIGR00297 family)
MIGMAVLAVGDVAAASVGESVRFPHRYKLGSDSKSVEGSAAMAVSSFLVILLSFYYLYWIGLYDGPLTFTLLVACVASCVGVVAEGISARGSDNFTIPLGVALAVGLLLNGSPAFRDQFALGFLLALATAVVSQRLRFLDLSGSAAAFVLGIIIFGAGGWSWALPVLVFFATSSILSKIGRHRKRGFDLVFEKGHTRDAGQVLANGGLAGGVVLASVFWPNDLWQPVYLGILAAVTADTWATEIGVYFRHRPVHILNLKRLQPGASGGITFPGTLGALVGAAAIAVAGGLVLRTNDLWHTIGTVVGAGFAASLADSILGATIQAQYVCRSCGQTTERKVHCDQETSLERGWTWITNDKVNGLCGLTGGWIMAMLS